MAGAIRNLLIQNDEPVVIKFRILYVVDIKGYKICIRSRISAWCKQKRQYH